MRFRKKSKQYGGFQSNKRQKTLLQTLV